MAKPTIRAAIFDFDDTLIPCKKYFTLAKADVLAWMAETFTDSLQEFSAETIRLAWRVRGTVVSEGIATPEVDEIIESHFTKEGRVRWKRLSAAIGQHYKARPKEGWAERAKRLQRERIPQRCILRNAIPDLRKQARQEVPPLMLRAMALTIQLEEVEEYQVFSRDGHPYNQGRFPLSCMEAYLYLCELLDVAPEWADAYLVEEIARRAFNVLPEMMPGAEQLLDELKERGIMMGLITRGPRDDPRIISDNQLNAQWRKYEVISLDRWIPANHVLIVSAKNPKMYERLLEGISKKEAVSIGNDYDGDLHPAEGMHRIWIPVKTWFVDSATHLTEDCAGSEKVLDQKGAEGWLTKEGLYIFRVESAGRVPRILKTFFNC